MASRVRLTPRLPSGLYVRRGRAVSFSELSATQQHAWRSHWAERAAETRAATLAAELEALTVVERGRLPGEMKRRGLRAFAADVAEEVRTKTVVRGVLDAARDEFPKANRGTLVAVVEWPDDPRSEKGRPYVTRVSRSVSAIDSPSAADELRRRAAGFFESVETDAQGRLAGPAEQHPSRGRGRAIVRQVHALVWDSKSRPEPRRKRRRRRRR